MQVPYCVVCPIKYVVSSNLKKPRETKDRFTISLEIQRTMVVAARPVYLSCLHEQSAIVIQSLQQSVMRTEVTRMPKSSVCWNICSCSLVGWTVWRMREEKSKETELSILYIRGKKKRRKGIAHTASVQQWREEGVCVCVHVKQTEAIKTKDKEMRGRRQLKSQRSRRFASFHVAKRKKWRTPEGTRCSQHRHTKQSGSPQDCAQR